MSISNITRQLRNKRILITGGRGFLGRQLVAQLKDVCRTLHLYPKDVRSIDTFTKRYDIVCHLAGMAKIDSPKKASLLFDVNVNGTLAVMQYCWKANARCIFASSAAVYKPRMKKGVLSENCCIQPKLLYGVSKMLAEDICRYHAQNMGISVIALRIFNMYGPGQRTPFLIPSVLRQLFKNDTVSLRTPEVVRDFVYVTDVVKAFILSSVYEQQGFLALNVGTGQGLSIYELTKRLTRCMKTKLKIEQTRPQDSKRDYVIADMHNVSKVLNWNPQVSINKGLAMVVQSSPS